MLLPFNKLFAPTDSTAEGGGTGSMDTLSELMIDDAEEPEVIELPKPKSAATTEDTEKTTEETEEKEEVTEEEDELAELEKELEGPDEKQLELMTPARRKDILKAYPDLFKKFPYLETAYYRDQKFTEIFPTIKEAESAISDLREYSEIKEQLGEGNIESIVENVSKDNKAFYKMVDNYLPALGKVSPEAYHHVIGNLIKHTVEQMVVEGNNKGNENLKTAATILHEFIFGTTTWRPPTTLSQNDTEKEEAESLLEKKEREFLERNFNNAQTEVATKVDNAIKATIDMHIDPNKQMTDYIKNVASEKAMKQLESLMVRDTRFKAILDKLWQNAADNDFSKVEMDKIKSACISKARTLLPSVIKSTRHEALKGLGKKVREESSEEEETGSKGKSATPIPSGKRTGTPKADKYAGMTIMEALLSDD